MTEEFLFIRVYGTETYLRKEEKAVNGGGKGKNRKVTEKENRYKLCLDRKVACKITFLQFLEWMAAYIVHC